MTGDKGSQITAVSWSFGGVATVVVIVRLYTRLLLTHKGGWDDVFIVISLLSAIVCSGLAQVGVYYGLGQHMVDIVDAEWKIEAYKYTVIAPNFSMVSTTTGKLSVVVFLLRLMGQTATPAKRWFLYIFSAISVAWNVLAIIAIMGFCRPPQKIWRPVVQGSCFSLEFQLIAGISQASFNAFADLTLAIFPIIIFWNIQLPWKMKVGVLAVTSAGILAAAATLVKAILLKNLPAHSDITWSWADITTWYSIEMYVIIICATLPTLRQSYIVVLHRTRQTASYYAESRSIQKPRPISFARRIPDASLFETGVDENGLANVASQGITSRTDTAITKTTEIEVLEERNIGKESENPHFPREDPFRFGPSKL